MVPHERSLEEFNALISRAENEKVLRKRRGIWSYVDLLVVLFRRGEEQWVLNMSAIAGAEWLAWKPRIPKLTGPLSIRALRMPIRRFEALIAGELRGSLKVDGQKIRIDEEPFELRCTAGGDEPGRLFDFGHDVGEYRGWRFTYTLPKKVGDLVTKDQLEAALRDLSLNNHDFTTTEEVSKGAGLQFRWNLDDPRHFFVGLPLPLRLLNDWVYPAEPKIEIEIADCLDRSATVIRHLGQDRWHLPLSDPEWSDESLGGGLHRLSMTVDRKLEPGKKISLKWESYDLFDSTVHDTSWIDAMAANARGFQKGKSEPEQTAPAESTERALARLFRRFHVVQQQLRTRHDGRPTLKIKDEYDVQDLLHSLLRLEFDDVRVEEWTPSYAGGSSRMDFLLPAHDLVIETKMSRKGLGAKELGEQLLVDVGRYRKHPQCRKLFCFVYDPGLLIKNPAGVKADLESESNRRLQVHVFIEPSAPRPD